MRGLNLVRKYGPKYIPAIIITDLGTWSFFAYGWYHGLSYVDYSPIGFMKSYFVSNDEEMELKQGPFKINIKIINIKISFYFVQNHFNREADGIVCTNQ